MRIKVQVHPTSEVELDHPGKGRFVVIMWQILGDKKTGQNWAVYQGSKDKCETLSQQLKDGFSHFGIKSRTAIKKKKKTK